MKPIARDTAYFRGIIETGQVYVDKTALLRRLATPTNGKFYFLSRPRRFGKSLMISTLAAIFRGERELFAGLEIERTDYDWKTYPVIQLDMSSVTAKSATLAVMNERVCYDLRRTAAQYGVSVSSDNGPQLFKELIAALAATNDERKVVILIDEYDAPISGLLNMPERLVETRAYLNEFYSVLKSSDVLTRFVMLTGVSKFTKLSIFSGLNSPVDITMDPVYGSLLGYTEAELRVNFAEHIHAFAEQEGQSDAEILLKLKRWYDGYHFSKSQREGIYNPYSIAYALVNRDFRNYWGTSGGATIIYERLKARGTMPVDLNGISATESDFDACDTDILPLNALLYQGGYLTIDSYDPDFDVYRLKIPNDEIQKTLDAGYVRECLTFDTGFAMSSLYLDAIEALREKDLPYLFDHVVHTLYASIPSDWRLKDEAEAKRYFLMFFRMLGADIAGEAASARGKADVILQLPNAVYIMEFKFNRSVDEAFKQIVDRDYVGPFKADARPVYRIGVNYSDDTRNITWRAET